MITEQFLYFIISWVKDASQLVLVQIKLLQTETKHHIASCYKNSATRKYGDQFWQISMHFILTFSVEKVLRCHPIQLCNYLPNSEAAKNQILERLMKMLADNKKRNKSRDMHHKISDI